LAELAAAQARSKAAKGGITRKKEKDLNKKKGWFGK
jgi:hypothetical protein